MSDGTLGRVAHHLVGAVRPLEDAFADEGAFQVLLLELGWEVEGLPPSYPAVADAAVQAVAALDALADGASADEILALIDKAGAVYRAVEALTEAPEGLDPAVFLPDLARWLAEYLLGRQLLAEAPGWSATLEALGIIAKEYHPPSADRPGFVRTRFDWDQIPAILSDPALIPERVYGWGTPDLNVPKVAELLAELTGGLGLPASLDRLSEEAAAALRADPGEALSRVATSLIVGEVTMPTGDRVPIGVQVAELPGAGSALPGLVLLPRVPDGVDERVELRTGWTLAVRAGTDLAAQLGLAVRPDVVTVRFPGAPGQQLPSAGFGISLAYQAETPTLLFGQPGKTRLELGSAGVSGAADLKAGDLELRAGVTTDGLALVIEPGDADGFLAAALGGEPLRVELAFGLAWSSRTGLDFTAGAGFEIAVYPHLDTGVLRVDRVDLALRLTPGDPSSLRLEAATALSGEVGPVAFSVDRLGVTLPITFASGNAGPFDVRLEPVMPTGMGLVVDAGPVTGGGFIGFDPVRGRYVGMIQLDVFDTAVSALAILDTRDPAGNPLPFPGFSLIAIVAVDLPPIQLGLGFVLTGVGGLAGLHRRLDTAALLDGVRTGATDALLFPADPLRDAASIIAGVSAVFPAAAGRHVFGPMARIEWGTPALLTIELAVVLEVPAPITLALVGTASVRLPEEIPVVILNIDVVGVLDQGRGLLAVDASLRDSSVAGFALGGDLAMRLSFGAGKGFALAVGGLHPHFDPPPGFPALRRVTLELGAGGNPRISIEGYLAVTSNSRQFGAKAELYAAAAGFSLKGWLAFDALFIRRPFSFRIDFAAGMGLFRGARRIAGVTVKGTLTGPNPFRVKGRGTLSLLFFDVSVPFDKTFGERRPAPELPPADPWPLLSAAITAATSWSGATRPGVPPGVTIRPPDEQPALLLLAPDGAATLRQTVVPLDRTLERFGAYAISGPDRFGVADVLVGSDPADWDPVTDHFSPGEFEELSESEQVSRDSFEDMVAGVQIRGDVLDAPLAEVKTAPLEYETRIIDTAWRSRPQPAFRPDRLVQLSATLTFSGHGRAAFARADGRATGVTLGLELYAVAGTGTLAATGLAAGVTKGAAHLAVKHTTAVGVQVVPVHELEEA